MLCYLVHKLYVGDKKFYNKSYSEEILVCEKIKLMQSLSFITTTYGNGTTYTKYNDIAKGEIILKQVNGLILGRISEVKNDYLIFETKEEALKEKLELLELFKLELLSESKKEIIDFIDNLKNKISITEEYIHSI